MNPPGGFSWNSPMASQTQKLLSNSRLFCGASWPMTSFQLSQISQHLKFEFPYPWFIHRPGLFSTQGLFGSAKCGERNYFQHIGNSALGCHILKNSEHKEPVSLKYHLVCNFSEIYKASRSYSLCFQALLNFPCTTFLSRIYRRKKRKEKRLTYFALTYSKGSPLAYDKAWQVLFWKRWLCQCHVSC